MHFPKIYTISSAVSIFHSMLQLFSKVLLVLTGSLPSASAVTVLQSPMSQNVSAGQPVEFTCATADNSTTIIISWNTVPDVGTQNLIDKVRPGGGKISKLEFSTLEDTTSNVIVRCIITDISTGISAITTAQLLVQGMI